MEPSARHEVFIDGKRIRTISIHAHCAVAGALDMKKTPDRSDVSMKDKNARLASMEAAISPPLPIVPMRSLEPFLRSGSKHVASIRQLTT